MDVATSPFQSFLNDLYLKYKALHDGALANYLPELAKVKPDLFSICVITVDGRLSEVGDYNQLFTIEPILKVFVYVIAVEHGAITF